MNNAQSISDRVPETALEGVVTLDERRGGMTHLAPNDDGAGPGLGGMPSRPEPASALVEHSLADMRRVFTSHGHHPTEEHWAALTDLLKTIDRIVAGTAEPALFVSALDPGVGKTTAVLSYLKAMSASRSHGDVGALVLVSRLDEVQRLASELRSAGVSVAIRTSDEALNALSTETDIDAAKVLLITQQRFDLVTSGKDFLACSSLFYRGQARTLRLWDESFLPGKPITVTTDDLAAVLRWLRVQDEKLHQWVEAIRREAEHLDEGGTITINAISFDGPEVSQPKPLRSLVRDGDTLAERDARTLQALDVMQGRAVTVRRDGRLGETLVSFERTMADNLLPLVVLDASARVRHTYPLMQESLPLTMLASAKRSYAQLNVHLWKRGGGKGSFASKGVAEEIIDEVADVILRDSPEERWLIITHKRGDAVPDLERMLRGKLDRTTMERVDILTWGNHAATNQFADVSRIVLLGTLFHRPSLDEALARLCLGSEPDEAEIEDEVVARVSLGESLNVVVQGLCRARIRKMSSGEKAGCDAYVIASARSGIPEALKVMFPDAHVTEWIPRKKALKGLVGQVLRFVSAWAKEAKPGDRLSFSEVYQPLNILKDTFHKRVRRNKALLQALAHLGVAVETREKYEVGFIKEM